MANTCAYQSVTLTAGNQVILPPGAELIAVTDSNLITLAEDCAIDLTKLEQLKTYEFRWGGSEDGDSDKTILYEYAVNNRIYGIEINGVQYTFANGTLSDSSLSATTVNMANRFANLSGGVGGLFFNVQRTYFTNGRRGAVSRFRFTTVPSVGDNMSILFSTGMGSEDYGDMVNQTYYYQVKPYAV